MKDKKDCSKKKCCCGGHNASNVKKNLRHNSTKIRLDIRKARIFTRQKKEEACGK